MIDEIDALIQEKHMLKTPFYLAWNEGKLSKECLKTYANQYYHHVDAFPRYLSSVHARCPDANTRQVLLDNLIEEEAGERNHPRLWKEFALSLGSTEEEIENTKPFATTQALVDHFLTTCQTKSLAEGVAALYAYESQIPEVSTSKIEGLKERYGLDHPNTLRYFHVHVEADEKHRSDERALLERMVTKENFSDVKTTVSKTLEHLEDFLNEMLKNN